MPIDPKSVDSGTPETLDGRKYPDHLRPYEAYDDKLLPLVERLDGATPAEIASRVDDARLRSMVPHWLASAEWRELIERQGRDMRSPRTYHVGRRGHSRIPA